MHDRHTSLAAYAKPDDTGSKNPDPTMQKPAGSPKGENMPPSGGEDISPAGEGRSPKASQEQVAKDSDNAAD